MLFLNGGHSEVSGLVPGSLCSHCVALPTMHAFRNLDYMHGAQILWSVIPKMLTESVERYACGDGAILSVVFGRLADMIS